MPIMTASDNSISLPLVGPPPPVRDPAALTKPVASGPFQIFGIGTADPGFNNLVILGGLLALWIYRKRIFA